MQRILSATAIALVALIFASIAIGYTEQQALRPLAESGLPHPDGLGGLPCGWVPDRSIFKGRRYGAAGNAAIQGLSRCGWNPVRRVASSTPPKRPPAIHNASPARRAAEIRRSRARTPESSGSKVWPMPGV